MKLWRKFRPLVQQKKKINEPKKKQSRRGRGRGASATPAPEPTGEGEENQAEPGTENPAKRPGEEALADEPNFSEKTGLEEVQQAEKAKQMQPMMQAAAVALARKKLAGFRYDSPLH